MILGVNYLSKRISFGFYYVQDNQTLTVILISAVAINLEETDSLNAAEE